MRVNVMITVGVPFVPLEKAEGESRLVAESKNDLRDLRRCECGMRTKQRLEVTPSSSRSLLLERGHDGIDEFFVVGERGGIGTAIFV